MSKYEVSSGHYFPVISSNTGKFGPEKSSVFGHFHALRDSDHAREKNNMTNFLFVSLEKYIDKTVLTRKIWYLLAEET